MKAFLLKTFKPNIFVVIKDQFLGDFVQMVPHYEFYGTAVAFKHQETDYLYSLNDVHLLEFLAKKTIIPLTYPENHVKLVKEIKKQGIKLKEYQKQQILEDGEASEFYQELLSKAKPRG